MTYDYRKDYFRLKTEPSTNLNDKFEQIKSTKHEQEMAVASKIMNILNGSGYSNVDDFYGKNNNLQDFVKKHMEIPITHFGHNEPPLDEEDYKKIIENIRLIERKKKSFETDDIKTTNIDDNKYHTYETQERTIYLDSSNENKDLKDRMNNIQETQNQFQTVNSKENTESLLKEIENRQTEFRLQSIDEINYLLLNEKQRKLYDAAIIYSQNVNPNIKVDLDKAIIVDEQNNIIKLREENNEVKFISNEDGVEKEENFEKQNSFQKKLTPNTNTIYSN